jgi:DNA-binding beta-propeller fold protein YncE
VRSELRVQANDFICLLRRQTSYLTYHGRYRKNRQVGKVRTLVVFLTLAASLRAIDPTSSSYLISTLAGGLPLPASAPAINYPLLQVTGVATDPASEVFISSSWNCVFKLDSAGNLTRVAGTGRAGYSGDGGPAVDAALNGPAGLAVDSAGNLYIADSLNHRVRRVSSDGTITTFAGSGIPGYTGDAAPATVARLHFCPAAAR